MGQHVWLVLATICTELLVIVKWGQGQFPAPLPRTVKWAWIVGGTLLVVYPIARVKFF
jgi:phosphatidylserine synthase 2